MFRLSVARSYPRVLKLAQVKLSLRFGLLSMYRFTIHSPIGC